SRDFHVQRSIPGSAKNKHSVRSPIPRATRTPGSRRYRKIGNRRCAPELLLNVSVKCWKRGKRNCSRVAVRRVHAACRVRGCSMKNLLTKIVDVKPDEVRAMVVAFVFNFVVLGGYYVI